MNATVSREDTLPSKDQLTQLITAPVGPTPGRQLNIIFRELMSGGNTPEEEGTLIRRAFFVLDNLSFRDAVDTTNSEGRSEYYRWFHGPRKQLMESLMKSEESGKSMAQ